MQDWNAQAKRDYRAAGIAGGAIVGAVLGAFVGWVFEIAWPVRGIAIAAAAFLVAAIGGTGGPESVLRLGWEFFRDLFVW